MLYIVRFFYRLLLKHQPLTDELVDELGNDRTSFSIKLISLNSVTLSDYPVTAKETGEARFF